MSKEQKEPKKLFVDDELYDCEGISKVIGRSYKTARNMAIAIDEADRIPCINLTPMSKKRTRAFWGSDLNSLFSGSLDDTKNEKDGI